jgi:esterase/lipase
LLYVTCFFNKHKSKISEQWNEQEDLKIKINGLEHSVSQRKKKEGTKVDNPYLETFVKVSTIDYFLKIEDIPCLFFREKDSNAEKQNLIIYFHGNGASIFNIKDLDLKENVFSEGYDFLIPELPGYPKNQEGNFSEKKREDDIKQILKFCETYYDNKSIVIIGHSLGCYFATLLASKDKKNLFKKLIIACPFFTDKTAAKNIVKQYTSCCCECCGSCLRECIVSPIYREKLSNAENIKNVKCNIDILYAPNDQVISPKDAESLFNIFKNHEDYKIDEDKDVCSKQEYSQQIRLRPIFPTDRTYNEESLLDSVNQQKQEKPIKNIHDLNCFFLGEERKVCKKCLGHNDVFLDGQIKYYIEN